METKYGKGLVGLYDTQGQLRKDKLSAGRHHWAGANFVTINGKTYSGIDVETFFLGTVQGFQYKEVTVGTYSVSSFDVTGQVETFSNCWYSMKGIMESVETMVVDIKTFGDRSGHYRWFDIGIFDPLKILGNTTVVYE